MAVRRPWGGGLGAGSPRRARAVYCRRTTEGALLSAATILAWAASTSPSVKSGPRPGRPASRASPSFRGGVARVAVVLEDGQVAQSGSAADASSARCSSAVTPASNPEREIARRGREARWGYAADRAPVAGDRIESDLQIERRGVEAELAPEPRVELADLTDQVPIHAAGPDLGGDPRMKQRRCVRQRWRPWHKRGRLDPQTRRSSRTISLASKKSTPS